MFNILVTLLLAFISPAIIVVGLIELSTINYIYEVERPFQGVTEESKASLRDAVYYGFVLFFASSILGGTFANLAELNRSWMQPVMGDSK
ncbi:hypothetical protein [Enterovibrio norvegicus]|uniref:hypothetical protein n=1 Tax=Enterovibrio norvegicus TaxID=188144 RepID=UPI00352F6EBD